MTEVSRSHHRETSWWRHTLLEIPVIIVSVLVALAFNEWRMNAEREDRVARAVEAVRNELAANKASLASVVPYHESMVEQLRARRWRVASLRLPEGRTDVKHIERQLQRILEDGGLGLQRPVQLRERARDRYLAVFDSRRMFVEVQGDSVHLYGDGNIRLRPAFLTYHAWESAIASQAATSMDYGVVTALSELATLHRGYRENVAELIRMLYSGNGHVVPALEDMLNFERSLLRSIEKTAAALDSTYGTTTPPSS